MPRDGADVYNVPSGTHGVEDTTIESARYNAFVDDVAQDLNHPRPILAGGTGATNAVDAMDALGGEITDQTVDNYDSFPFLSGSFHSAAGVTSAPNSTHAFLGIVYLADANNMVVEARDATDGFLYVRRKTAGVWGAWTSNDALIDGKVAKAGDTMTGFLTLSADPTALLHAVTKQYTDAAAALGLKIAGHQTTTGGFRLTAYDGGSQSGGTFTPDAYNGNYQFYTNNGAHTLAAPANDCAVDILITNSASAGAITFSGFTVGPVVGDPATTTNGHRFLMSIRRINGISTYVRKALQ